VVTRSRYKQCGGSSICEHNRIRSWQAVRRTEHLRAQPLKEQLQGLRAEGGLGLASRTEDTNGVSGDRIQNYDNKKSSTRLVRKQGNTHGQKEQASQRMALRVIKAEKMDTAEAVATYITPIEISTEDHDQIVRARLASRTVIDEATEETIVCFDKMLEEIMIDLVSEEIIDAEEKSWIEIPLRPEGEAQKERTGLLPQDGSEIYNNYYTALVPAMQEHEVAQIEIADEIAKHNFAMDGRDAMGRFIVQDGLCRMTPKPKLNAKEKRQRDRMSIHNRKDNGQAVGAAKAKVTDKARAKAIMDDNRQARKRAKRRFMLGLPPTRRKALSEEQQRLNTERADAKQQMLRESQEAYLHNLALKHDLQQQEGRYVKAPCYLKTADKKEADRRYRAQAMEMGADMMKAGTIANSARATQIEEQVLQDWKTRHKLSRKWGKIMQGRSKIRIRALKREPYNKATVWVGSKVTKPGVPVPKKAPLHMLWKTHVVGDAIVQTCGKAGNIFTKWARRLPNVPAVVPTWSLWPQHEERHDYGYAGKDAWAKEQSQQRLSKRTSGTAAT
jgi:hypothetical protein